jgi:hypothetical protein
MKQETLKEIKPKDIQRIISSTDAQTASIEIIELFTKWQAERSYSEKEVLELLQKALTHKNNGETGNLITAQGEIRTANFYSWFEQNKKK